MLVFQAGTYCARIEPSKIFALRQTKQDIFPSMLGVNVRSPRFTWQASDTDIVYSALNCILVLTISQLGA